MTQNTKTYPITDQAAIAAKIKALGGPAIDPSQTTGEETAEGVTISWAITSGQITLTVVKKPWMIPYSAIWSHADSVFYPSISH